MEEVKKKKTNSSQKGNQKQPTSQPKSKKTSSKKITPKTTNAQSKKQNVSNSAQEQSVQINQMSQENKGKKPLNETLKKRNFLQIFLLIIVLALLITILLTKDSQNKKAHCAKAVCNEDSSLCYNYSIDKEGNTVKTWEGSCQNK